MRKKFGPKTYMYPLPVLIIGTYGDDGTPDAMNAAWGGISDYNQVALCLSESHKTTRNILKLACAVRGGGRSSRSLYELIKLQ